VKVLVNTVNGEYEATVVDPNPKQGRLLVTGVNGSIREEWRPLSAITFPEGE